MLYLLYLFLTINSYFNIKNKNEHVRLALLNVKYDHSPMNSKSRIPQHLDKHEYIIRTTRQGHATHLLGCHFLNNLPPENSIRVFSSYAGFLVLKGRGDYLDWTGCHHQLSPGYFGQHIPGKHHHIRRDPTCDWLEASVSLGINHYHALVTLGAIDPSRPVFRVEAAHELWQDFEELYNHLSSRTQDEIADCLLNVHAILRRILSKREHPNIRRTEKQARIQKAGEILSANLAMKISLKDVAKTIGMSYPHFRREFLKQTGVTPGAFRIQRRIEQANMLLNVGEESIQTVSDALGYPDPFTFSKQFKKVMGVSPINILRQKQSPVLSSPKHFIEHT